MWLFRRCWPVWDLERCLLGWKQLAILVRNFFFFFLLCGCLGHFFSNYGTLCHWAAAMHSFLASLSICVPLVLLMFSLLFGPLPLLFLRRSLSLWIISAVGLCWVLLVLSTPGAFGSFFSPRQVELQAAFRYSYFSCIVHHLQLLSCPSRGLSFNFFAEAFSGDLMLMLHRRHILALMAPIRIIMSPAPTTTGSQHTSLFNTSRFQSNFCNVISF